MLLKQNKECQSFFILSYRLSSLLPMLISPEQSCFITGGSIYENIGLAHEMVNDIDILLVVILF